MDDSELREELRRLLADSREHARPPSFGSPPRYIATWNAAIEEGWITEAGVITYRGRSKLNELRGGHWHWFKSNASTIIPAALSVTAVTIAALALVIRD